MATPLSPEQRERVIQLCMSGQGRNAIAEQTGISLGSISNIIKAAGLSFDRVGPRAATAARQDDLAELRSRNLVGMYTQTATVLERLTASTAFQTIMKGSFGEEKVKTLDFIPARDFRELAAAAAQLALAANRLEQANNPQAEKVKGLLGGIADQLGL